MRPGTRTFTRRELIGMGVAGIGASIVSGCQVLKPADGPSNLTPLTDPTVLTRVTPPKGSTVQGFTIPYSNTPQDAVLYVPTSYQPSTPSPFVLMLPGENQVAINALNLFQPYADANGLVLMGIDPSSTTWDMMADGFYGPDVFFINYALAAAFNEVNVDPSRVTVEGFSDGASYALAMGLTNGALFSRVISFSAKYIAPYDPAGNKPSFFMSQGSSDAISDPTQAGDFIDSTLTARGYAVDYVKFDGAHEAPDAIVQQAVSWMVSS